MEDYEEIVKRTRRLTNERGKRFRERHSLITFGAPVSRETYEKATLKLKEKGITKQRFIEKAIEDLLNE